MPRGGTREGAGRKPVDDKKLTKAIRFSNEEWEVILQRAKEQEITPSEYIRRKALQ